MDLEWVIQNKEWLFSGCLISIPIFFLGYLFKKKGNIQKQKGGNNSVNIQSGKDTNIN